MITLMGPRALVVAVPVLYLTPFSLVFAYVNDACRCSYQISLHRHRRGKHIHFGSPNSGCVRHRFSGRYPQR